jgi:hypothetical protein
MAQTLVNMVPVNPVGTMAQSLDAPAEGMYKETT